MMKLYSEKTLCKEQPSKETIEFLIGYSKQLRVVETDKNECVELHLN